VFWTVDLRLVLGAGVGLVGRRGVRGEVYQNGVAVPQVRPGMEARRATQMCWSRPLDHLAEISRARHWFEMGSSWPASDSCSLPLLCYLHRRLESSASIFMCAPLCTPLSQSNWISIQRK
jgi:hypothetical protein